MNRLIFAGSRLRSLFFDQLNKPLYHSPFLEPLQFDYHILSNHLECFDKNGRKLYEIEFREGPPVGGLAIAELVNPKAGNNRILDLGTGSGVIALAMASKGYNAVVASEVGELDCQLASRNVRRNRKEHAIDVIMSDFACSVRGETFDVLISNPPQLPTNLAKADVWNFAGPTGYEAIDKIIAQSKVCLGPMGELWLYVLGFLGVEKPTGPVPCLFERLRRVGFYPIVKQKLRRKYSQDINIQAAFPLIQALYPMSDIARNFPMSGCYETFVVRASRPR